MAGERITVHLDTDIGGDLDDLCALAYLLAAPQVELTGVTTVVENDGHRAGYVHRALALAGRSGVPVAAGAPAELPRFKMFCGLPPEERYWPEPVPPAPGPVEAALDLLEASIEQGATVVGIGPYTNLALLEERRPGTLRRATLYLMGGHVSPPPPGFPAGDHEQDFNVQVDTGSAQRVFETADPAKTTIVPIEITVQTALRRAYLPQLRQGGPLAALIAHQAEEFARDYENEARIGHVHAGLPDDLINFQHDPLACAVALGWGGVTVEALPLSVQMEGEWLRLRPGGSGPGYGVVTAVDRDGFNQHWLDVVLSAEC